MHCQEQADWNSYKKIQKKKHVEDDFINNIISEPGSNKKLFAYIKGMKFNSSGVTTLEKDGINYSEPTDKVETLNEQFASALTKKDNISMPTMETSTSNTASPLNIQVNRVKKLQQFGEFCWISAWLSIRFPHHCLAVKIHHYGIRDKVSS